MITRPNLDLLSALAPAAAPQTVAALGSGTQNLRFDAAMLQAAKTVRDGSREGVERTLTPKVEQALESLLNQLAQQPAEQVRQWASQPDLLKPAVEALAQAYGLNAEETAELHTTAPMATQALIQAFDGSKASTVNVVKIEAPEPISGPQGREPGMTADPAKTLKPQAEAPSLGSFSKPDQDERKIEIPMALAQASAWAASMVSSRTDDGSSADSSLSLSSRPVERNSEAVAAPPVSVKVSALQPSASTVISSGPQGLEPVPVSAVATNSVEPVATTTASAQPSAAPSAKTDNSNMAAPRQAAQAELEPGPSLAGKTSVTEEQSAPPPEATAPASPARNTAVGQEAPQQSGTKLDLDFQVTTPSANSQTPVIQDGSLFVLNNYGSSQGVRQVTVQSAETGVQEQAPLASTQVFQTAESANGSTPAQTPVTAAPVQANVTLPVIASPVLPSIAAQLPASITPVTVPATAPLQAEAAQPLDTSPKVGNSQSKASSSAVFEPKALENSAGFQALQHSSHEDAPQSGMAFGQETLRHLMTQVARELGVREAAFTQVSDALAQATAKENSHLVIKLKPASLGEVQVDLSVEGGKLTARLLASTPEVRDAFVRDLPAFKASLEAQGLRIDQVSVAVRADSNFNPQGQDQGQPQPQAWAFNRTLAQAAPELAAALSNSAWSSPALNDQRFSALA
jgi:flagellar hook-length control protein FliK